MEVLLREAKERVSKMKAWGKFSGLGGWRKGVLSPAKEGERDGFGRPGWSCGGEGRGSSDSRGDRSVCGAQQGWEADVVAALHTAMSTPWRIVCTGVVAAWISAELEVVMRDWCMTKG